MLRKTWAKTLLIVGLFVILLALDSVVSLEGLPFLLILLGLAALATERVRSWLKAHERASLATLPFMTAALVLLFAFTKGRDISQGVLLVVTLAVVFDILLVALALIAEGGKRGILGVAEFFGLVALGLVLGLALSLFFAVDAGRFGATSLAGP